MSLPERALVLGLGRFGGGLEATRFLRRRGCAVRVADRATAEALGASADALRADPGVELRLGEEGTDLLDGVDAVVVNPAIPRTHPLLVAADARGVPLTQEVNLLLEAFPGRVVLVTGTNGKSTTASLLAAALQAAGQPALLGGNIGHSLLADEDRWRRETIAVLEISSFQLERTDPARHPTEGAVLTAVTSDHLDRHGTLTAYHAAKARAPAHARGFFVHGDADAVAAGFASPAARRITFTRGAPSQEQVGLVDDWIVAHLDGERPVLHASALRLEGTFQLDNAMAAFAAATALGADHHRAAVGLAETAPLPHRLQCVAEHRGVRLYDNGVSTDLLSTLSALEAVAGPIHWVGGGKSKDGRFAEVATAIAPRVASAHVFGAAAPTLGPLLAAAGTAATTHETLEQALASAWERTAAGDALLFSPAFASFDQFPNFRARAEVYRSWVRRQLSDTGGTSSYGATDAAR